MRGMLPYAMPRPPPTPHLGQHPDAATGNSSSTTILAHGVNQPSTTDVVPDVSGYHYKKKNTNNQTTPPSIHSIEPERDLTPKDDIVTIGKADKLKFSLSSFIGGVAPVDALHHDPSSPRSISGASAQYNTDLAQGPNQEHPETGIQNKLEALEPANTLLRLRKTSSTMSLKLKIPRLRSAKQKRNDSDAQFPALHSTNLPLSSNLTFGLGRVGTQRNSSIDSTHLGTEEGIHSAINMPSRSATSIGSRNNEESAPASSRPATAPNPTSILRLEIEDKSALPEDILASVIHGSEYRKSRARRAHPITTQDDILLDARSAIDRYTKSWRHSRRASVSTATNLMSFPEFRALSPPLKGDRYPNKNSDDIKFLTSADPGNSESKSKDFVRSPSLALQSSTEDLLTPTAPVCTDMSFPLPRDISLHDDPESPVRDSTSTPPSRAPSSDAGVSASGMTSTTSLYTTSSIHSHLQKNKPTAAELKQWRQDVEMIITSLDDEFDGEVCLMRFEPKQGWFGFWNQENITDILDDLRALRSPKS